MGWPRGSCQWWCRDGDEWWGGFVGWEFAEAVEGRWELEEVEWGCCWHGWRGGWGQGEWAEGDGEGGHWGGGVGVLGGRTGGEMGRMEAGEGKEGVLVECCCCWSWGKGWDGEKEEIIGEIMDVGCIRQFEIAFAHMFHRPFCEARDVPAQLLANCPA